MIDFTHLAVMARDNMDAMDALLLWLIGVFTGIFIGRELEKYARKHSRRAGYHSH